MSNRVKMAIAFLVTWCAIAIVAARGLSAPESVPTAHPHLGAVVPTSTSIATANFASDANRVLVPAEYNAEVIHLTGTQTRRDVEFPLQGCDATRCRWTVVNLTALPVRAIGVLTDGGESGSSVWIAASSVAVIRSTGTNLKKTTSGNPSGATLSDMGSDGGSGVVYSLTEDEECFADGTDYRVCTSAIPLTFTDATTWVTFFAWAPNAGEQGHISAAITADDQSANANFSLNADAAGGGGVYPVGANFTSFKFEAHVKQLSLLPDGGPGSQLYLVAQAGSPGPVLFDASVLDLGNSDCHACTHPYDVAGCVCGGTSTWNGRFTVSGSTVLGQLQATGTTSWPWIATARVTRTVRVYP
jgi:hypothetical protein